MQSDNIASAAKPDAPLRLSTKINPFDIRGVVQPSKAFSGVTNESSMTGKAMGYCIYGDQIYFIDDNALLHKAAWISGNITDDANWPHTIEVSGKTISTSRTGDNVVAYRVGTSNYIFYSFMETGGDGYVGRYDLSTTFDDDWMATEPTDAAVLDAADYVKRALPLMVGDDGILYIGDGNQVHGFDGQDGANGSLSKNVLDIPAGYYIQTFVKFQDYLVIFANKIDTTTDEYSGAYAFFWDYCSPSFNKAIDLEYIRVTAAVNWQGTIACFMGQLDGYNISGFNKNDDILALYTGQKFETVAEIDNAPVNSNCVLSRRQTLLWNESGDIYSFGNHYVGVDKYVYHELFGAGGSSNGILLMTSIGDLLVCSGDETFEVQGSDYVTSAVLSTAPVYLPVPMDSVAKLEKVTVYFQGNASGGRDVSVDIIADNYTIEIINSLKEITGADANGMNDLIQKFEGVVSGNRKETTGFYLNINYTSGDGADSAPKIREVAVDFTYQYL